MVEPIALSLGQQFEIERMNRAIDATCDAEALRGIAKQLLHAWHSQKAATQWVMRQQLGGSSRVPSAAQSGPNAGLPGPALSEPGEAGSEAG